MTLLAGMINKLFATLAFAICFLPIPSAHGAKAEPRSHRNPTAWTIMAYVNGRNNGLEAAALCNFYEMLVADSSSSVTLVVEMSLDGRSSRGKTISAPCNPIEPFSLTIPYWRGTRRFIIRDHKQEYQEKLWFGDLRKPKTLERFVRQTIEHFPADHYMLILWDHGEGTPRLQELQVSNKATSYDSQSSYQDSDHAFNDSPDISMYKSGTEHSLLNTQIKKYLEKALKSSKLDIIGFDACYKGMIETAYAMSSVANVMVASEESEPSTGWDYFNWLSTLDTKPDLSPEDLASVLVSSYRATYQHKPDLTSQSAVELTKLTPVVDQLDALARLLLKRKDLWAVVASVRRGILQYQFQEVDLSEFIASLEDALKNQNPDSNQEILAILEQLKTLLKTFISQPPYASAASSRVHKSHGIAIYFPCSQTAYEADPDFRFYDPRSKKAIPFFSQHNWGTFLREALPRENAPCGNR